ncbi:cyclopropane fatty acyl phospholipid synthase [Piscinibacter sakaiensis]|uniref:cyclopropane fatty acyl phospholipid synthase n=1 Tax=Piscinibacter sakaiensis TaxID=1547922 RepID=UPI003AB07F52
MATHSTHISDQGTGFSPARAWHWMEGLLAKADIRVQGDRPWDIRLLKPGVPERVLAKQSVGLGEAYMDGQWTAERLDQFFERLLRARIEDHVKPGWLSWQVLRARWLNRQTERRAWQVGQHHYDLGNDFYRAMLDKRMTYTCGYWKGAKTLDEAQENKLDLVCRKLQLRRGMRVLDIGCGWGSLMKFAAERYGVSCVGVTVSERQTALGRELCKGLPVEFRLQDYRRVEGQFDAVVSLGMFEHVGERNYRTYMELVHRVLRDDGLFLLHTIGRNEHAHGCDPWVDKYIFPNGQLPTIAGIGRACERLFVVEDLHNFGADYDPTLMAWHANFEASWPQFETSLGERFYRMWRYYLLSCAGAFRARDLQLWQWVLSKNGVEGGYQRPS